MDDEELLMHALAGLYGPEEEEDPYADPYAPWGPAFIPPKTNSRGETDFNASFNVQQDHDQIMADALRWAMMSAATGVPYVDYNQQAPMEAPVHTPTLDSLRQSGDEVLANVAMAIDAGSTPFEIEAEMRAKNAETPEMPTYDDDQIDLAVRAAEQAFEENGFAQRAQMENASAQSPMEQMFAEAGLPSPLARYGDPGYDLPVDVQGDAVTGRRMSRIDDQLAALERQVRDERDDPTVVPTGSAWRDLPGGRGNMDDPVMQEWLAETAAAREGRRDSRRQERSQRAVDSTPELRAMEEMVAAPLGAPMSDPTQDYRIPLDEPPAVRQGRWPGEERDRWAPAARPQGGGLEEGLQTVARWMGGGDDEDRMTAAFGTPLDLTTPQNRGPAANPSSDWRRSTPASPAREPFRYSEEFFARSRVNNSAANRSARLRQSRAKLERRENEEREGARGRIGNLFAARGRSPFNDMANARQNQVNALVRQLLGG